MRLPLKKTEIKTNFIKDPAYAIFLESKGSRISNMVNQNPDQ